MGKEPRPLHQHPAASPKALSPQPTTLAPHHRLEPDTWTGGCQRPWRGCRPHVPAESPHTLLTRLFCSERSTGKSQTGNEKRRQPVGQEVKIRALQPRSQPAALYQTVPRYHDTTPGSVTTEMTDPNCTCRGARPHRQHRPTAGRRGRNSERRACLVFRPSLCASSATVFRPPLQERSPGNSMCFHNSF